MNKGRSDTWPRSDNICITASVRAYLGCWVNAEVAEGLDAGLSPTRLVRMLHHKHMISEDLAKLKRLQATRS